MRTHHSHRRAIRAHAGKGIQIDMILRQIQAPETRIFQSSLDARVCVQGFPCKGLNFRLPLIFQCNCDSLIFRISLQHLTLREDLEYVRVVTTVRHFRTMQ